MKSRCLLAVVLTVTALSCVPVSTMAESAHSAQVSHFAENTVAAWLSEPVVIDSIREQNARLVALTQTDIIKLDRKWRAQATAIDKPMVDELLSNSLSTFLMDKKAASRGQITEIFVMDAKGLNVGQSDVTSDYWQGDEAKWQRSYGEGAGAIFIDRVEEDESTQAMQSQVSMTISDPDTGQPIGAITVGVNLDMF